MSQGTGSDIKISKTIRKAIKHGGSLWGSLINLGSKLFPMAMTLAMKAIYTACNWRFIRIGQSRCG